MNDTQSVNKNPRYFLQYSDRNLRHETLTSQTLATKHGNTSYRGITRDLYVTVAPATSP